MAQTPVDRLVELSMVPELAKEVRSQIEAESGGITPGAAIASLTGTVGTANDAMTALAATTAAATGADTNTLPTKASVDAIITANNNNLADLQAKVNAILAALRTAGIIAT